MAGYLIRRFFQMIIVVLLSTMAIYMLLNIAPGGPLSGLKVASADRKSRVSDADIARLEAYLKLDRPLALRYLTWLIGDDWLGADWMYLGLSPIKVPKLDSEGNPVVNDQGYRPCVLEQFNELRSEQIIALMNDPATTGACDAQIAVSADGAVDKTRYWSCIEAAYRDYKKDHEVAEGAVVECSGRTAERDTCREQSLPEERLNTCEGARDVIYMPAARFWADPGPAYLNPGYEVWVWGEMRETDVVNVTEVWVKPKGDRPADVTLAGQVVDQDGKTVVVQPVGSANKYTVHTSDDTRWQYPTEEVQSRPEGGNWLNISWLFGADGLLGQYVGFHGDQKGVLRLDWGLSWKVAAGQPVSDLIRSRLGNTLLLMTTATLVSLIIAIPIGVYSAVHQYSKVDYVVTTFTFFGTAMPVFWFGLMMILLFSYLFKQWGEWTFPYLSLVVLVGSIIGYRIRKHAVGRIQGLEWRLWMWGTILVVFLILVLGIGPKVEIPLLSMPAGGTRTLKSQAEQGTLLAAVNAKPDGVVDRLMHIVMPAMVLSLLYMAGWSRFMRSAMLEVLRQDYVRTARAKGLRERVVIAKHALRNALIPIITIVVFQIPGVFSGATLTETIFSYPGIGRLYFDALSQSDWPIMMIILFITAILVVVATLLGDILYTIVDPRIRYN